MTQKLFVASAASLVLLATVYAGGWAISTVRDFPEYAPLPPFFFPLYPDADIVRAAVKATGTTN